MENIVTEEEITKWLNRMEELLPNIEASDSQGEEILTNIKAYIADCKHFLKEGKLVLSFECMVHAFAIFETCELLGVLKTNR